MTTALPTKAMFRALDLIPGDLVVDENFGKFVVKSYPSVQDYAEVFEDADGTWLDNFEGVPVEFTVSNGTDHVLTCSPDRRFEVHVRG